MKRFSPAWIRKLCIAGILATGSIGSLAAFPWSHLDGELNGSLDTTVSWGMGFRMTNPDKRRLGLGNGGTNPTGSNVDDGNLNYRVGDLYSHFVKAIIEVEASYKNWSFFSRMDGIYDFQVMGKNTRRTPLSKAARGTLGHDARLLDAFVQHDNSIAGVDFSVRFGEQVINWGESTFVQNGLNVINPIDVGRLRVAGAELREALLPLPIVRVDLIFSETVSVLGFWNWHWKETRLDPKGSFFSTLDNVSPNGHYSMIDGEARDIPPLGAATAVARSDDRDGSDLANGGIVLQYFSEWLNNTEFGLYFGWQSSRLPLISSYRGEDFEVLLPSGFPGPVPPPFVPAFTNLGFDFPAKDYGTVRYFVDYPDHLKYTGISFNTMIGDVALQGEYSWHFDQPWQRDIGTVLAEAIIIPVVTFPVPPEPAGGEYGKIQGWFRGSYSQFDITATHLFPQALGADSVTLLYEVAGCYVHCFKRDKVGEGYDRYSMGYRVLTNATYNNVFRSVTLTPQFAYAHDFFGSTPLPLATFVKDKHAFTLSLTAAYQSFEARADYTYNCGGGAANSAIDRDFLTISAQYSY